MRLIAISRRSTWATSVLSHGSGAPNSGSSCSRFLPKKGPPLKLWPREKNGCSQRGCFVSTFWAAFTEKAADNHASRYSRGIEHEARAETIGSRPFCFVRSISSAVGVTIRHLFQFRSTVQVLLPKLTHRYFTDLREVRDVLRHE